MPQVRHGGNSHQWITGSKRGKLQTRKEQSTCSLRGGYSGQAGLTTSPTLTGRAGHRGVRRLLSKHAAGHGHRHSHQPPVRSVLTREMAHRA
jgi:hypothetical protein